MASKASLPSSSVDRSDLHDDTQITKSQEQDPIPKEILSVIDFLKKQVAGERCNSVQKRMEENKQKLVGITTHLLKSSTERRIRRASDSDKGVDLLTKRQKDALDMQNGINVSDGENDRSQEDGHEPSAVLLGSNVAVRNAVRPIKLPEAKTLPPYTTWIFLDRNQRMTEDQSVVGRRRIYYDQSGGEALICSDSEEEVIEDEEEKRDFVESEDYILRMTIKEIGSSDLVLESLASCFSRSPGEIQVRYEVLTQGEKAVGCFNNRINEEISHIASTFLDKDLDAALDSFDNLFCRRCLVFDCRLHGCSQDLVFPAEKQPKWGPVGEENVPCGPLCYRSVLKSDKNYTGGSPLRSDLEEKHPMSSDGTGAQISKKKKSSRKAARRRAKSYQSESASSNAKNISESSESENELRQDGNTIHQSPPPNSKITGVGGIPKRNSKRVAERVLICMQKKQKKMAASESESLASVGHCPNDVKIKSNSYKENDDTSSSSRKNIRSPTVGRPRRESLTQQYNKFEQNETLNNSSNEIITHLPIDSCDDNSRIEECVDENLCKQDLAEDKSWKAIEKGLYEKGIEIFGRNSCLIARNLLNGMKTCWEIFQHMNYSENKNCSQVGDGSNPHLDGYAKGNNEVRRRSRFLRRRGRVRRLKYTWKSAAYHSIRKRITERKDQPCRQYNPCSCQTACGKQCACLLNGTCCEKYCGCPKSCKNRFRGCHCAKSQCRSRQCPCFAADRECDPDVCRNCWVSCGDGTLGVPNQRGDNYECRNMKLLLKQQQRVLLGRSDISGWGAFLKNSVGKHEYLGEYTGELISHREADKRGKIYDRENSSFLFNLNDQFVLDAYRKGDKLKFANHSPVPNCYAKVIMVAGDHRVGIFAKERISAGEELFYDYRYEPDRAPAWARKPEASGSKKDDGAPSSGRAKKLA
ncbi:histone-lysine N-methyltransferase CLF-like isoform X1 [Cucurbita maxima]|uniref:Histone-lysine N-methyltransferase CLF-like isoform X1 n=2 Tax=Cucurbita maxima TaxID=3661 RepID=A0A6J1J9F7_CUCMA|nr:histone-lysine N-methyltransferase CLF-like isoform X1 [Cucurbita maxima]